MALRASESLESDFRKELEYIRMIGGGQGFAVGRGLRAPPTVSNRTHKVDDNENH